MHVAVGVAVAVAGATIIEALWLKSWAGRWSVDVPLMVILFVLAAAACHFPVELTPRFKTDAGTAVHFAIVLLFAAPIAVALVGASVLFGNVTLALRRGPNGRRRRGVYDSLFNTSQLMIAAGIGAAVLYALRPETPAMRLALQDAVAVPATALAMYLTNTVLVALMVAWQMGRNAWDVWASSQRIDAAAEATLYLIGFVTAVLAIDHRWAPLAMAVPAAVVYVATKRAVLLDHQTIGAVEAMADMVDRRDRYTAEHSVRVAANAAAIAKAMRLSSATIETVRLAARVHDLGKVALPDEILHKPGKLSAEEFALMKEHPRQGCEILAQLPQYRKGREIVLAHHERVDGTGYPRGLTADRIPIGAQIVAVADALDAMTSNRPYRAALPLHQAMTELRLGRGTQWSATVVDTLSGLVNVENPILSFGAIAMRVEV